MMHSANDLLSNDTPDPLIVILDDEPSILAALRSLFHRRPYRIQLFTECGPALQFLTGQTPDIIISDMRMPVMNGMSFLTKAQELCPVTTRLLLSGYEDKSLIIEAVAKGTAQMYILKPWEDEEILEIVRSALSAREDLRRRHLETYIHSITTLPSSPLVQEQVKQVFTKHERSIREVATIVEKDPVLVAQLMRVANSVFFGARNPITNIQEAITFIGLEYVEGLLLGSRMFASLGTTQDEAALRAITELWHHAVQRGLIGRTLAAHWPDYPHQQPAYLACLLLDIGFIVRLQMNPGDFHRLTALASTQAVPLHQAEGRLFDVDHAAIGGALLRLWNIPPSIVCAIEGHHSVHTDDALTQLAQIADAIESGDPGRRHDPRLDPAIQRFRTDLFASRDSS
jgi:HD-like signal output (HDOD) protein/CheY-like chemotaxis protein